MNLVRVFGLILFFFLTACSTLAPKPIAVNPYRCPSSTTVTCTSLLPFSLDPVSIPLPLQEGVKTSAVSEFILETIERLEMPEAYDQRILNLMLVEMTFSQFIEAYRSFSGGAELTEILLNRQNLTAVQIKAALGEWIQKTLPGYSFVWNKPGEDNIIEESRFFRMLKNRQIPIADHHDLLVHPYLMLDPLIRELTERIADIHVRAQENNDRALMRIANLLWTRLQEYTPIEYRDAQGGRRLTVIGGGASLVNPFSPAMGNLEGWNYMAGASELFRGLQSHLDSGQQKNNPQARQLFENIVRYIEKTIDVSPGFTPEFVFNEIETIPNVLTGYFAEISAPTYGDHWKAFSQQVLQPKEETALASIHPENHRKLMRMSIELAELLAGITSGSRCPAGQQMCLELLPTFGKIEVINTRVPKDIPVSIVSRKIVQNLEKMSITYTVRRDQIQDQNLHNETFKYMATELSFTQFIEAYQTFPGGSELITILSDSSMATGAQLKERIDSWAKIHLAGYRIEWPSASTTPFIEEVHFFNLLSQKVIPIGNHHDILAHLFLFLDPKIRDLTERIANVYDKAVKDQALGPSESSVASLVNYMWVRLQEHTPVEYRDRDRQRRLAIVGGFPSLAAPFESLRGGLFNYIYFKADFWRHINEIGQLIEASDHPQKQRLLGEFKDLITLVRDISEAPDIPSAEMLKYHFSQISHVLDVQYQQTAIRSPSYQQGWLELSNRVFDKTGHPAHSVLLPENHRLLMERIIHLLEGYFTPH